MLCIYLCSVSVYSVCVCVELCLLISIIKTFQEIFLLSFKVIYEDDHNQNIINIRYYIQLTVIEKFKKAQIYYLPVSKR